MRYITIIAILILLKACGITSPQNVGHAYKFTLSSIESSEVVSQKLGSIVLDFPKANAELDTYRIALLRDKGKRDYFAGARWADFLPVVIQSTLVESLQNSGYFSVVAADHANVSADYQLQVDIKAFHADYTESTPPTITIKIHITLAEVQTLKVIKTYTLTQEYKAENNNISSIHTAFDNAFAAIQKEMVDQIIKTL